MQEIESFDKDGNLKRSDLTFSTKEDTDLAINHLTGMSETHHVKSSMKFVILDQEMSDSSIQHRKIMIEWEPGKEILSASLLMDVADYKEDGFRCIDTDINGLTSGLRLVKGDVSLVEEYRIKLETRIMTKFNVQDSTIKIEFVPRTDEELTLFEKSKLPFLETIKDYSTEYGSDHALIRIESYHKKAGHVEFTIKDDLLDMDTLETMIKKYHEGGSVSAKAYLTENWAAKTQGIFSPSETPSTFHTKACTECKGTGFYTPLIGPPEPCRACHSKPSAFAQNVSRLFSSQLHGLLGAQVKGTKSYGYHWQTFCADIGCSKDHDQPGSIAEQAAKMIHGHLIKQYTEKIAFEDVYGSTLTYTPNNTILHMRSNYQGVSAWVSMREIGEVMQFQFQVRVSP